MHVIEARLNDCRLGSGEQSSDEEHYSYERDQGQRGRGQEQEWLHQEDKDEVYTGTKIK